MDIFRVPRASQQWRRNKSRLKCSWGAQIALNTPHPLAEGKFTQVSWPSGSRRDMMIWLEILKLVKWHWSKLSIGHREVVLLLINYQVTCFPAKRWIKFICPLSREIYKNWHRKFFLFLVLLTFARTASWNTSSKLSFSRAEHSRNAAASMVLASISPSSVEIWKYVVKMFVDKFVDNTEEHIHWKICQYGTYWWTARFLSCVAFSSWLNRTMNFNIKYIKLDLTYLLKWWVYGDNDDAILVPIYFLQRWMTLHRIQRNRE